MGPYIIIKVLSNNKYTIRKNGTRCTQTLHRIRLRPYVPEQRMPDVTVRSNEYFPDPENKVSHNEWYAVSWEMEFGKQTDEHEKSEIASNNQQTVTQNATVAKDETLTPQVTENQIEDTNDVAPPTSDFSNVTTDAGNSPYIRHPHWKSTCSPKITSLSSWI